MKKVRIFEISILLSILLLGIGADVVLLTTRVKSSYSGNKFDDILDQLRDQLSLLDKKIDKAALKRSELEDSLAELKLSLDNWVQESARVKKGEYKNTKEAGVPGRNGTGGQQISGSLQEDFLKADMFPDKEDPQAAAQAEHLSAENDYLLGKYLQKGEEYYLVGNYSSAAVEYKSALGICPENPKAILFYNASLFLSNPGDEANFHSIKNALVSLYPSGKLDGTGKRILKEVLSGIVREEGGSALAAKDLKYPALTEAGD